MVAISAFHVTQHSQISLFFRNQIQCIELYHYITQFPGSAQLTPWLLKAQFIRRAAAVPNQIGRIKFGSSTVAARRMNRA